MAAKSYFEMQRCVYILAVASCCAIWELVVAIRWSSGCSVGFLWMAINMAISYQSKSNALIEYFTFFACFLMKENN